MQPSPPVDSYNEGSGEYNNFADEDEDDSNFNYDYEGSGNDDNDDEEDAIEDSYSPRQPTDNFQNSRNNYQDPYGGSNSWNNPEPPKNPWDQNNFNQQQNNNFNSQYSPTQQVSLCSLLRAKNSYPRVLITFTKTRFSAFILRPCSLHNLLAKLGYIKVIYT